MRLGLHRGSIAAVAALAVLGLNSCSEPADPSDHSSTSASTTASSTTVPRSTTSVLPACSTIDPGAVKVNPAVWLPAEVPEGWRLDAAATVGWFGIPGVHDGNQIVVLDGDTVTGMLTMGTGAVTLIDAEPVVVRGTRGSWGSIGGRSMEAVNPYLVWHEDGVDWWVTGFGVDQAAVLDAVAAVELSSDPVGLTDPTGRLVQVGDRPRGESSTMVVLSYDVPGGTATSLGGGTGSNGGEPTDRVQVIIEQFAPGGSGILVDDVAGPPDVVGWHLVAVDDRPVLRTPAAAEVPVVSGAAMVTGGSDARVAVSVTGSPSADDADAVMARVTPIDSTDERLATADVDVDGLDGIHLTACLPDGADGPA